MQIFNLGILEIFVILILMFLLLGPKEMVRTAYRIGVWIRKFVRSPMWREIMNYSQEFRDLPQKIMEDTGLKETLDEVRASTKETTDALNSQLKEAVDAARVPEMENLRIDPRAEPAIVPVAKAVQAGAAEADLPEANLPEEDSPAEPAAETGEPDSSAPESALPADSAAGSAADSGAASTPAVLNVAETAAPPVEKKTRRRKVVAVAEDSTGEEPRPRRGRKPKKTEDPAADELPAAVDLQAEQSVEESGVVMRGAQVYSAAETDLPAAKARKPRARKSAVPQSDSGSGMNQVHGANGAGSASQEENFESPSPEEQSKSDAV